MSLWNIITRDVFEIFFFEVMTSFSFVGGWEGVGGGLHFQKCFVGSSPLQLLSLVNLVVVGGGGGVYCELLEMYCKQ